MGAAAGCAVEAEEVVAASTSRAARLPRHHRRPCRRHHHCQIRHSCHLPLRRRSLRRRHSRRQPSRQPRPTNRRLQQRLRPYRFPLPPAPAMIQLHRRTGSPGACDAAAPTRARTSAAGEHRRSRWDSTQRCRRFHRNQRFRPYRLCRQRRQIRRRVRPLRRWLECLRSTHHPAFPAVSWCNHQRRRPPRPRKPDPEPSRPHGRTSSFPFRRYQAPRNTTPPASVVTHDARLTVLDFSGAVATRTMPPTKTAAPIAGDDPAALVQALARVVSRAERRRIAASVVALARRVLASLSGSNRGRRRSRRPSRSRGPRR